MIPKRLRKYYIECLNVGQFHETLDILFSQGYVYGFLERIKNVESLKCYVGRNNYYNYIMVGFHMDCKAALYVTNVRTKKRLKCFDAGWFIWGYRGENRKFK